jgi:SAM-dependent methyltransferase
MSVEQLTDDEIRGSKWYYQVELRPGVYTAGIERRTAAMVRALLERIDLTNARCLDIGAQEALISVSLARLGSSEVVAYDRVDRTASIDLVREAYDVEFDYRHGMELAGLPSALARPGYEPFDVVVFAGVLYHLLDPLAGLGVARSFVRENGLLLVETATVLDDEPVLHFNAAGRHYPGSTYFLPSLGWLDYALRMLRLKPIDCVHISKPEIGSQGRVAIVCRATDRPLALGGDSWMSGPWIDKDMRGVSLDYAVLASSRPGMRLDKMAGDLPLHPETDSVDVFQAVLRMPAIPRSEKKGKLNLSDYARDVI